MSLKIVHLEDEKDLQDGMAFILQELAPEAEVQQFATSTALLPYLEDHWSDTDLFILDVRVPGPVNGMGVAQRIRELGSKAVIVVTSAFEPPSPSILRELNIHYFRKPWDLPETIIAMLDLLPR
jgi:DNA-binding response OmpR family regulator